jgi:hypothetical protein
MTNRDVVYRKTVSGGFPGRGVVAPCERNKGKSGYFSAFHVLGPR